MKVKYTTVSNGTKDGRLTLEIIPETDFEKSFIKRNKWANFMNGNPIVMVEEEEK